MIDEIISATDLLKAWKNCNLEELVSKVNDEHLTAYEVLRKAKHNQMGSDYYVCKIMDYGESNPMTKERICGAFFDKWEVKEYEQHHGELFDDVMISIASQEGQPEQKLLTEGAPYSTPCPQRYPPMRSSQSGGCEIDNKHDNAPLSEPINDLGADELSEYLGGWHDAVTKPRLECITRELEYIKRSAPNTLEESKRLAERENELILEREQLDKELNVFQSESKPQSNNSAAQKRGALEPSPRKSTIPHFTDVLERCPWLEGYTPEEIRSLADDHMGKDRKALLCAADRLQVTDHRGSDPTDESKQGQAAAHESTHA